MLRPRRTINRRHVTLDGANAQAEPTDYNAMSTEALRLTLGERHLQQTGNRCKLIARLQQNEQRRPPAPQPGSGPSNSNVATGVPNAELAALIASIVDERMNRKLTQDGGASHCSDQLARPSPRSNIEALRSSPPPPPQDGGQNTGRQLPLFKVLQLGICSQTRPFLLVSPLLLVLVPSPLLLTSPIQPKSRPSTRTSGSLPSQAI